VSPKRLKLVRFALLMLSAVVLTAVWIAWYGAGNPVDAWAIYDTAYGRTEYAYIWSPAFAQVTAPLRLLGFTDFAAVVRAAGLVSLFALAPYGAWIAFFLPPVAAEINAANINLVLMVAVVASLRFPAAWALPLLTKPSMGVGMLWYLVRREWRSFAIAAGVTGVIAVVSFVVDPSAWWAWLTALQHHGDVPGWPFPWPIWVRFPIAALIVVWGARTDRPWTVALAAVIGMPRLYFMSIAMLVGLIPLMGSGARRWTGEAPRSPAEA
jgi:hypothetical protein